MRVRIAVGLVVSLALLTVGGTSALAASAASFHDESSPVFLGGSQTETTTFTVTGGNQKCKSVEFSEAEVIGTKFPNMMLTPTTSGCSMFGISSEWNFNGCTWNVGAESSSQGRLSFACPAGKEMEWKSSDAGCTIRIPTQTPGGSAVPLTNSGSGSSRSVLLRWQVTGIRYTSSGGFCGASGSNGAVTGTALIKGYKNPSRSTQQGLWAE
jgi:hypothetical protein